MLEKLDLLADVVLKNAECVLRQVVHQVAGSIHHGGMADYQADVAVKHRAGFVLLRVKDRAAKRGQRRQRPNSGLPSDLQNSAESGERRRSVAVSAQ